MDLALGNISSQPGPDDQWGTENNNNNNQTVSNAGKNWKHNCIVYDTCKKFIILRPFLLYTTCVILKEASHISQDHKE